MSVRHAQDYAPGLGPRRITMIVEGFVALVLLVALSATLVGIATWATIELVRTLLL
jgi:hypothetical protein